MKIYITNHDVGSIGAILPVANILARRGHQIVAFGNPESLGFQALKSAGWNPVQPCDFSPDAGWKFSVDVLRACFEKERPDLVWGGISCNPQGTEKLAFEAAQSLGIKTACSIETWPQGWQEMRGGEHNTIYKKVSALFVPDTASSMAMRSKGFEADRVLGLGNPAWEQLVEAKSQRETYRKVGRATLGIPESALVVTLFVTNDHDDPAYDDPSHLEYFGAPEKLVTVEYLAAISTASKIAKSREIRGIIRQKPGLNDKAWVVRGLIDTFCPEVHFDIGRTYEGMPARCLTTLASDVCVGHNTLAIQDAAIMGVPGIYYVPGMAKARAEGRVDFQKVPNDLHVTVPFHRPWMLYNFIIGLAERPSATMAKLQKKIVELSLLPGESVRVADEIERRFGRK